MILTDKVSLYMILRALEGADIQEIREELDDAFQRHGGSLRDLSREGKEIINYAWLLGRCAAAGRVGRA